MQPYNNPIFTPIKNNNFDILSSNKQQNLSSSSGIIWGKIDEFSISGDWNSVFIEGKDIQTEQIKIEQTGDG